MTAAERILQQAAVDGLDIRLRADGQPVIWPAAGCRPSAAMLAALREHRAEVIRLLGGDQCGMAPVENVESVEREEPWRCDGYLANGKKLPPLKIECGAWIFESVDCELLCDMSGCPMRRRARHHG